MKNYTKIWSVQFYDGEEGWVVRGYFSTEEKAKMGLLKLLTEEAVEFGRSARDYNIEWDYMDMED